MIEIVDMTLEHIAQVCEIEEAIFPKPWSAESFRREVEDNNLASYKVAILDGKVVGYIGMWHVVTEGDITKVAVSPAYRAQGIGRMLLDTMIELAENKEMIGITLEVSTVNQVAYRLYESAGFEKAGIRKNYYETTNEDAYIMWKYF